MTEARSTQGATWRGTRVRKIRCTECGCTMGYSADPQPGRPIICLPCVVHIRDEDPSHFFNPRRRAIEPSETKA